MVASTCVPTRRKLAFKIAREVEVMGRGGTDLRAAFEPALLQRERIDAVRCFSDGQGPFLEHAPAIATLWVSRVR
jgi:predicted metal-dependent peptidase